MSTCQKSGCLQVPEIWQGRGRGRGGAGGGTGGDFDHKNLVGRTLPKLSFQARAQYCEWDKLKHAAILSEDQQM